METSFARWLSTAILPALLLGQLHCGGSRSPARPAQGTPVAQSQGQPNAQITPGGTPTTPGPEVAQPTAATSTDTPAATAVPTTTTSPEPPTTDPTTPPAPRTRGKYPGSATVTTVTVSQGSANGDEVKKHFVTHRDALAACYETSLEQGPKHNISGDVFVDLQTDASGQVTSATRAKGSLPDQSGVLDCVLGAIKAMKLPGGQFSASIRANFYLTR